VYTLSEATAFKDSMKFGNNTFNQLGNQQASRNRRFDAPIPLFAEEDHVDLDQKLKVKLRQNPETATPKNEKEFILWSGHTAEGYCKWRDMLQQYIDHFPLDTPVKKFNGATELLFGNPRDEWQTILESMEAQNTDELFEEALDTFALLFMDATARTDQKRFMHRHIGKPKDMTSKQLHARLSEMNRYIKYMPGDKPAMEADELTDIFVYAHKQWTRDLMTQSDFRYWEKTPREVVNYLSRLSLIEGMIDKNTKPKSMNDSTKPSAHKASQNKAKNKKQCNFCHKYGHLEAECRNKKRAEKNQPYAQKPEEHNAMEEDFGFYDSDEDLISFLTEEMVSEATEKDAYADYYPLLTTRNPSLNDTTSTADLVTEVCVVIKNSSDDEKPVKLYKVLVDTGCSCSIVRKDVLPTRLFDSRRTSKETIWNTNGGTFLTKDDVPIVFTLPEFAPSKEITWTMAVDEAKVNHKYDMIIGRDLQQALGIDILWSKGHLAWEDITIPMKSTFTSNTLESMAESQARGELLDEILSMDHEGDILMEATNRAMKILDASYEKADVNATVDQMDHLSSIEKQKLKALLFQYEHLFDGTLGHWDTDPVNFELKDGAKPYHARPFPIPYVHEGTLKKEIDRLVRLGVLKKCSDSEWASPTFIIPKKNNTVRVVSDFRKLNSMLRRKPYPIPKIQDVLQKLGGFTFATSLDLNMGYYTIKLTPESSRLCTIVFPFGKYQYQCLPMGVAGSPDVFQDKMNTLMEGLEFVRCYLDDLLTITKESFDDHLSKLEIVLERLSQAGLRVNITKSAFATQQLEYLGYLLTPQGIRPIAKKVEAILRLQPPKTVRQL